MVFRIFILIFLFRTLVKKNTWIRMISITVMVTISNALLWKLLDICYVQSSFSTFTRHIDNGNLKDTLQLKISQRWICANSFLVNIMKRKWTKGPGKLSVVQNSEPLLCRAFHLSSIVNYGIGEVLYLSRKNLTSIKNIKSTYANKNKNSLKCA